MSGDHGTLTVTDTRDFGLRIENGLSRRMAELFPADAGAVVVVASGWEKDPVTVEGEAPAGMAPSRAAEFLLGRGCAHAALGRLGGPGVAIPRTRGGAPGWPGGFTGSITHGAGLAGAAVAPAGGGLGIDIELARAPEEKRSRIFLTAAEREWVAAQGLPAPGLGWEVVMFCAKEAVFKAQTPEVTADLGLRDFSLLAEPGGQGFSVPALGGTEVGWALADGVVLAAAVRRA